MALGHIPQSGTDHILAQQPVTHQTGQTGKPGGGFVVIQSDQQHDGSQKQRSQGFLVGMVGMLVMVMAMMVIVVAFPVVFGMIVTAMAPMIMAAVAFLAVFVVVMAAAAFTVFMVMVAVVGMFLFRSMITGVDHHFAFHASGDFCQFRDQGVRILCGQAKLLGGKGDNSLLHLFMGIEFCFDFCRTVGTVQIF